MSRIDRFFIWTDRYTTTQLAWAIAGSIFAVWTLFAWIAAEVLL